MNNRRNYYRILQVQPDAPIEIISSSYRTLMRDLKRHPDLGGELWSAEVLNEAYEILSNSSKRAEYDRKLFETYVNKPCTGGSAGKKNVITFFCPFCKRPLERDAKPDEHCRTCKCPLHPCGQGVTPDKDHHRAVERLRKYGKLKYYSSWPQKGKEAKMLDVSTKGIRFVCKEKLRPGATIKLSSPLLRAIAEVKDIQKSKPHNECCYTVGVEFLSVSFAKTTGSFVSTYG